MTSFEYSTMNLSLSIKGLVPFFYFARDNEKSNTKNVGIGMIKNSQLLLTSIKMNRSKATVVDNSVKEINVKILDFAIIEKMVCVRNVIGSVMIKVSQVFNSGAASDKMTNTITATNQMADVVKSASLILNPFIGSLGTFSASMTDLKSSSLINRSTEIPKRSAIFFNVMISGIASPLSHFEMALSEYESASASVICV
jgi:hypothetical protein